MEHLLSSPAITPMCAHTMPVTLLCWCQAFCGTYLRLVLLVFHVAQALGAGVQADVCALYTHGRRYIGFLYYASAVTVRRRSHTVQMEI